LGVGEEMALIIWHMPALVLVIGYLLGSIPFGLLLTRMAGAGDLRAIGSGNIGATNVLRTGRKGLAALTLLLDGGKGAAAVAVGNALLPDTGGAIGGLMAFIGHCYPVWLRFRGGKGVATMLGVTLALAWPAGLVFAGVWLAMLALTRMSSAGGMSAAISAPVFIFATGQIALFPPVAAMALLLLWRHRGNIARILKGTEPGHGPAVPGCAAHEHGGHFFGVLGAKPSRVETKEKPIKPHYALPPAKPLSLANLTNCVMRRASARATSWPNLVIR